MGKDPDAIKLEIEETRERMSDTVEALGYKADVPSRVKEDVGRRINTVKGTIGDVMDNVKTAINGTSDSLTSAVSASAHEGADSVKQQTRRVVGIVKENPIGLALVGLAIGYLVGSVLPSTEVEREPLGQIGDAVADRAQATTQSLLAAGKAVVADTAQTLVASAQSHSQQVVEAARSGNGQTSR